MLAQKNIVVVVPVGPGSSSAFIADTIESFQYYTTGTYAIVLMDDSHQGIGRAVQAIHPHINVLYTPRPLGGWAGLYISLATAYHYAFNTYKFKAILKLDTDALVINNEPEKEALSLFAADETIGIAGQYPLEYDGTPWDIAWPKQRITNATQTWKFFARPTAHWHLRKQYAAALQHKYRTGESVFGGAYFMSYALVEQLATNGLLPCKHFNTLNLGEDHLFALLAKANGFQLASLSGKGQPFACAWKGLPAAPRELYNEGRKIIHSVRSYKNMNESEIRTLYRKYRNNADKKATFLAKETPAQEVVING